MPAGQVEEFVALALVFVVHVVGGGLLVWALIDGEQRAGWRRRWGSGGDEGPSAPPPPSGGAAGDRATLPLPGATPSSARLRESGHAADAYPRPARRPAHAPQPAPRQPAPAPGRRRRA